MQQLEGENPPEAQSPPLPPPPVTVNTVSVERSLLCVAVGQIVINIVFFLLRNPI